MGLCLREGCRAEAHTRGWCERHYRHRLHTGRYGYRDATPARARVRELRDCGWTYDQIADAAGIASWTPHRLATGGLRRVLAETESAILAIAPVQRASHRGVSGVGTYRRIQALQWMGWPMAEIGSRVGLKPYTLTTMCSRGEPVSKRTELAVRRVYDELAHLVGPSKATATKAKNRGYAPPLAWDDETIDCPAAAPELGEVTGKADRAAIVRSEYRHLSSLGMADHEIAKKLGVSELTLRRYVAEVAA